MSLQNKEFVEDLSLHGKLEADVEIKAPANKFHQVFAHSPHHISNISLDKVQACDLHEGDWGEEDTVICWSYVHDGKAKTSKQILERIDFENNLMTFNLIGGDLMEEFKTFKITFQAIPKENGEQGSTLHWTFEYEKLANEIAHPETLLAFVVDLSKDIDAHLVEQP